MTKSAQPAVIQHTLQLNAALLHHHLDGDQELLRRGIGIQAVVARSGPPKRWLEIRS